MLVGINSKINMIKLNIRYVFGVKVAWEEEWEVAWAEEWEVA